MDSIIDDLFVKDNNDVVLVSKEVSSLVEKQEVLRRSLRPVARP